ncbi:uncharacterized protein E0L32_005410 [Thyridium curvatum]|uniref:PH-response regulator protein palI/RIM9 n=1 Tax=Thyridium curvatum TaxID=1093900 RepID=A0A507B5R9_9PEZI|nr:uncharacterized protein E0L32_005410 [Thyridium curvatum]TPX14446.1 hypothetical protein E0L32_005410 [Thyridium curvatum]
MLRPATPLAVLLGVAFALLLIAVLSTPIIKQIPLGAFHGVTFGVFGVCKADGTCSKIEIGYNTGQFLSSDDNADFNLPPAARNTLSSILVVHPVAALFTLIMFVMSIVAHFHSPSHSIRYLLFLFIVSIFAFLACLLAFLIDVLLFVPHLAWGSYLVLAATILVALSGIISCAMRRTLVSRKTRKKRIAENAEMSGENYYNRQAQQQAAAPVPSTARQPTVPVVSGANGDGEKLPAFATFEKKDDRSSDERIPLTARSPADISPNAQSTDLAVAGDMAMNGPPGPRRSPSIPRDQYGNPMPMQDGYGVRRGPSQESMNSRGRGRMPPGGYRGRGGYGPPGGRGGYGPPGRGGYGPGPGGRGGYGPPPRGYGGPMRGGRPPPPGYQYERAGPYGMRGPSPGPPNGPYNSNPSMPSMSTGSYDPYNPEIRASDLPRAESPPPLPGTNGPSQMGQAVEMDAAANGPRPGPPGYGPQYGGQVRDSDSDIAGMVGLQQGRGPTSANRHDTYMSDNSRYSQDGGGDYVPPRAAWNQGGGGSGRNSPRMGSPLGRPAELPATRSPPPPAPSGGSNYYEDVDPRFAEPPQQRPTPPPPIQVSNSYEDIPQGARSPAESERSNFTSISQRGINPRWNPPPPALMPGYGGPPPRRPVNRSDVLLNNNPDFQLPGRAANNSPRPGGPNNGMVPGSAYPAI